jgi:uroporphyrinogen III methyltransferase/synthase
MSDKVDPTQKPRGKNADPTRAMPGVVYLVGAGPGDPGLLTQRAAALLSTVDLVLYDELVHPALLELAPASAELRSVGKRGGDPQSKQQSQRAIEEALIAEARSGRSVLRLKGGDPFLFGRGSEEAEALVAAGLPFEVVPGIPSPLGATAYAGISVTHRDLASSVTFVSATTRAGEPFDFRELSRVRGTVCVLMGMHVIDAVTARLIADGARDPATPAAVIQWGTRADQAVIEAPLASLAARAHEAGLGSPAIIVVGPVVELRRTLRWFDTRPLFGKRVLVTRPEGQSASTAALLRLRGAEPIELPAISIDPPPDPAPLRDAVRALDRYDLVAFTSENGVRWFFRELDAQGKDARAFGRARLAAIGSGTALALEKKGVRADIVPAEFRGEGLARAILDDPILRERRAASEAPLQVLIPRALVAREVLPAMLREAGCEVSVVPAYETHKASAERRDELIRRLEQKALDVVMLTSSSTADSLCELLGPRAAELLQGVLIASIGPITTATAEKRGLTVGLSAEESTLPGLIRAMEAHFERAP